MEETKIQWMSFAILLLALVCFHQESWGQNSITNIPQGWIVNGVEVKEGKVSGIADSSLVVLTPTETDLGKVKAIFLETVSLWEGMSIDLRDVSSNNMGWVIASNGRVYPHVKAAKAEKTVPVATIAFLGSEADCKHGLAIAVEDVSNSLFTWDDAPKAVTRWASSHPVKEASWRLPTVNDLFFMNEKPNRAFDVIVSSGGERVHHDYYWTSNEHEDATGIYFLFINNLIHNGNKTHQFRVRAVLAF
ncbi:MAG: DUF1566 domain-containing protein [Prevotella sp.]|nr:DUF1566 domain-containing protein [Prevotella sp.]